MVFIGFEGGGARHGGGEAHDGEGDGAKVSILLSKILYGLFSAQEESLDLVFMFISR